MFHRSLRIIPSVIMSVAIALGSVSVADASVISGAMHVTSNAASVMAGEAGVGTSTASGVAFVLSQYISANSSQFVQAANNKARVFSTADEYLAEGFDEEFEEDAVDVDMLAVAQVSKYVNVRAKADENSDILGKLYNNGVAKVIKEKNGWYKIKSGNVTGFVKSDYVVIDDQKLLDSVGRTVATVNTVTLKVRQKPSTEAEVLELVPEKEELEVLKVREDGWVKVLSEAGEGFVSGDFVTVETIYPHAESRAEEAERLEREAAARRSRSTSTSTRSSSTSGVGTGKTYTAPAGCDGQSVADYAVQFVGNPYVYGGSSLTNGTDCSGFVMSVYEAFGVDLPHSSYSLRSEGYGVSTDELKAGDILCYSGHVAIYIGNNSIVHASTKSTGIKITNNAKYRTIVAARRIFD